MEGPVAITAQIEQYLASLPEAKRSELGQLHSLIVTNLSKAKLWYGDGRDEAGKVVSNPNIGYGEQILTYADGRTRTFYQVGISANTAGISVYLLGLKDKEYLSKAYGRTIGKASVTGYCIKFKSVKDVDLSVLLAAIMDAVEQTSPGNGDPSRG